MTYPLVTAAVTAFNAEKSIEKALLSVIAQDWPQLEVIVVDDGSVDRTPQIVEGFIRVHSALGRSIRLIRMPANGGVAAARNRLVQEAQGEFLAFFDDDDISMTDRVSRQYSRIIEAERFVGHDLILCHTARKQIFPDGAEHYEGTMGCEGDVIPSGQSVVDRILIGRTTPGVLGSCATCSQMARVTVYRRLGGFDSALRRSEDTDLNVRCGLNGGAFVGLGDALVVQEMTAGTEKNLSAELEAYATLQDKYHDYLVKNGWYDFCLEWQSVRRTHLEGKLRQAVLLMLLLGLRHPVMLLKRIYWSLPAHSTRRRQRGWYQSSFLKTSDEAKS